MDVDICQDCFDPIPYTKTRWTPAGRSLCPKCFEIFETKMDDIRFKYHRPNCSCSLCQTDKLNND